MVTREQCVIQSTEDFVEGGLADLGYGPVVKVRDAFPTLEERATELTQTNIAIGFTFDDGGRRMELGSDLTQRVYTIEFWVFGRTSSEGENVAHAVRVLVERGSGTIPLKDIEQAGGPVIDQLLVQDERAVTVTRQLASNPRSWDRFVWTVTVKVEDVYYPSLVN